MIAEKEWTRYELLVITDETALPIRWRRLFNTRELDEAKAITELKNKLNEHNAYTDKLQSFIDMGHRRNTTYCIVKTHITPVLEWRDVQNRRK